MSYRFLLLFMFSYFGKKVYYTRGTSIEKCIIMVCVVVVCPVCTKNRLFILFNARSLNVVGTGGNIQGILELSI